MYDVPTVSVLRISNDSKLTVHLTDLDWQTSMLTLRSYLAPMDSLFRTAETAHAPVSAFADHAKNDPVFTCVSRIEVVFAVHMNICL